MASLKCKKLPSSVAVVWGLFFFPWENNILKYARKVKSSEAESSCRQISERGEGERRITDSAWQYTTNKERLKIEMGTVVLFLFFPYVTFYTLSLAS